LSAKVGETGYFAQTEPLEEIKAGREFRQAAFALSYRPDPPYSDPIPGEDGYYVLEYLDRKPSRIADFAEVRTNIVATLQQQRKLDAVQQRGRTALDQVRKLVATNKTFAAACAELKLLTEAHGPFTVSNNKLDIVGAAAVQDATVGLAVNAISEFIPTGTGGLFFLLKDRQAPDRAEFEKSKAELTARLLQRERRALFDTWLNFRWREAKVDLGKLQGQQPVVPDADEEPTEPPPVPGKS
jgi:hypothetical protein